MNFIEANLVVKIGEPFVQQSLGDDDWQKLNEWLRGVMIYPNDDDGRLVYMLVFAENQPGMADYERLRGATFPYDYNGVTKEAIIALDARPF